MIVGHHVNDIGLLGAGRFREGAPVGNGRHSGGEGLYEIASIHVSIILNSLRAILLSVACVVSVCGQTIELHSEFQRVDPFGQIVDVDRSANPREILSPEVPRNGHAVFHVAVTTPPGTSYFLFVGSNPANIIQAKVYKEDFVRIGERWIPDGLTLLNAPYFGVMPDSAAAIPGQTTRCYMVDLWVPPNVSAQRVRVEVLMKIGEWYIAPMEVRIVAPRVPSHMPEWSMSNPRLPEVGERIDTAAIECVADYLLGAPQTWIGGTRSIRDVIRRDAEQDVAIAREFGHPPLPLWLVAGAEFGPSWMSGTGAEWYLPFRDWIYRKILLNTTVARAYP
jgi:hypothetical protein